MACCQANVYPIFWAEPGNLTKLMPLLEKAIHVSHFCSLLTWLFMYWDRNAWAVQCRDLTAQEKALVAQYIKWWPADPAVPSSIPGDGNSIINRVSLHSASSLSHHPEMIEIPLTKSETRSHSSIFSVDEYGTLSHNHFCYPFSSRALILYLSTLVQHQDMTPWKSMCFWK